MSEGNARLGIPLGTACATLSAPRAAGAHGGLYIGALADRQQRSFLLHASESSRVGREGRDGLRVLLVAVPRAMPGGLSSPMPPIVANTTGQEIAVSRQVSPPSASAPQLTPMKMFLDKMQVVFLLCRLTAESMVLGRGAVQDTLACRETEMRQRLEIAVP